MRPGDTGIAKRVVVGVVIKPVGLKGEIKVKPLTDNPDRYAPGSSLWFAPVGGKPAPFVVEDVSEYKGILRVLFAGIESVEEAERYRGQEIFVPEAEVPPLPEGEYYHFQIIGLDVYASGGRLLGKVTDIFEAGEKDVYVIKGRGKEYLVPATGEHIREIDVERGRITLYPMEGYIPEDEV